MKDVGLRIRVQRELRDAFLAACRAQDKPAAQVLREFMRAYVQNHPPDREDPQGKHSAAARLMACRPDQRETNVPVDIAPKVQKAGDRPETR